MKGKRIKMNVKKLANTVGHFLCKNSPYILSGIGAGAVIAGSVVVAKKAKKAPEKIDTPCSEMIANAKEKAESKKELTKTYSKVFLKYTAYYAAPVLLIGGGVACMLSAVLIQTKRLQAISAAYTSLAAAFNAYRERVKEAVGPQAEEDIYFNVKRDDEGNIISSDETDDLKKNNERVFSRLFGDGNTPYWTKDTKMCVTHIQAAQGNCNAMLREQGYLTLNDALRELGFAPSEEGMYLGWIFKYGDPVYGSTYVDFGFGENEKNRWKIEELNHSWNQEMWVNIFPPHSLFQFFRKEKIRTEDEKENILMRRNSILHV